MLKCKIKSIPMDLESTFISFILFYNNDLIIESLSHLIITALKHYRIETLSHLSIIALEHYRIKAFKH